MIFAVIENNIIVNVILADSEQIAQEVTNSEVLDITDSVLRIGNYRDENGIWKTP
jgi:hypothetical protein